jgi:aryl-alcohol dehydrogenase-like predicted oxidoreductase/RimJ/RimL family protein N-acetyltransferase
MNLPDKGALRIETGRFYLRPLNAGDATKEYSGWFSDPVIRRYIAASENSSIESIRDYISEKSRCEDVLFFGVFLKENSQHIGNIKFEPIDLENRSATLGIMIGDPEWRGRNVAAEVIDASTKWLLKHYGIFSFKLGVHRSNAAAIRAYEKVGFEALSEGSQENIQMALNLAPARRISIGTVLFGMDYGIGGCKRISEEEAGRILATAASEGVDSIDTAMAYGGSESTLGSLGISKWNITSKLDSVPSDCPNINAWVETTIRNSLMRLRVPKLSSLLLHRPKQLLTDQGSPIFEALQNAKAKGLIEKIGISIYDPSELDPILSKYACEVVQAPLNLIDRRLVHSHWEKTLQESGIELQVRSVFLQGLLLMNGAERPEKFVRWTPIWNSWEAWLRETKVSPLEACLRFVLSSTHACRIVVGIENRRQLLQIIEAVSQQSLLNSWPAMAALDAHLVNPALWNEL